MATFKLTAAQQQQLRGMRADSAEAQIAAWRAQWKADQKKKSSGQLDTTDPPSLGVVTNNTGTQQAAAAAPAVPADWEKAARELYGGYYAIVENEPELKDLLLKAAQQGYTAEQFEYELRQTAWYRTNSASAREWQIASQADPATAAQNVQAATAFIQDKALTEFNVQLDSTVIQRLATDSLRFKWSTQLLSNAIGLEATRTPGGMSQLASGYVGQSIKQIANDYGLRLSDENLNQWVGSVATGQQTSDNFRRYAIQQAKQLFPAIGAQLDSGQTFQQIVDPYKNVASKLLEINSTTIDFTDPKWATAISFADQSGNQRPMTFSEWSDYLRQTRSFGYEYTADAQSKAYQVANDLANLFGKV